MRLTIVPEIEIESESPIMTAELIIDMHTVGAEQIARDFINCMRSGENIYNRVNARDIIKAMKDKAINLLGCSLYWEY
jgi:ABC-type sulfate transport system substrate-binding protein